MVQLTGINWGHTRSVSGHTRSVSGHLSKPRGTSMVVRAMSAHNYPLVARSLSVEYWLNRSELQTYLFYSLLFSPITPFSLLRPFDATQLY